MGYQIDDTNNLGTYTDTLTMLLGRGFKSIFEKDWPFCIEYRLV